MNTANPTVSPIEQRLADIARGIHALIPAAEVRLFGSRARGEAHPGSDVDLLITAPDAWLAQRDRFSLLADLWGAVAQPDLSVDLDLWCTKPSATACCSMASPEAARLLEPDGEEASWGWAAQQCLEKTLKAWLYIVNTKPPHTHDLARLLLLLQQADVDTTDLLSMRAFTTFAVQYRYDDEPEDLGLDRCAWCDKADALIEYVARLNR